jgi:transcriptional regulator with XRE-family HTH domain
MAPDSYRDILARNIASARTRKGLGQEDVAIRMRALGYEAWIRQTVSSTERGRRRPTAEEIFGLSLVLETTISRLMAPLGEDQSVELPSGESLPAHWVQASAVGQRIANSITWQDNKPVVASSTHDPHAAAMFENFTRLMTEGRWPSVGGD